VHVGVAARREPDVGTLGPVDESGVHASVEIERQCAVALGPRDDALEATPLLGRPEKYF
jgi:hypothetical protein